MNFHFIIIEHNSLDYLRKFIESILNIPNTKITIFDNNSNYSLNGKFNESIEIVNSDKNIGYGKAVNFVANSSDSDYLFICNSDLVFLDDTFEKIYNHIKDNPWLNLFGIQQLYPNMTRQYSYGDFPSISQILKYILYISQFKLRYINDYKIKKVQYIDGAFIVIKRKIFNEIKGFDEDFFFYSEDADLCYRAKKRGINSYIVPNINIIHHRGASTENNLISETKSKLFINGLKLFLKKHHSPVYSKLYFFLYKLHLRISIFSNSIVIIFKSSKTIKDKILNNKTMLKNL